MASPTQHEGRREADGADYSVEWAAPDFHLKATARPRAHPIRAHPITLDLNLTLALALALSLSPALVRRLQASEAKREILSFIEPPLSAKDQEKVFVHIVDISHGRKTTVADPHDTRRRWKTFDPNPNPSPSPAQVHEPGRDFPLAMMATIALVSLACTSDLS